MRHIKVTKQKIILQKEQNKDFEDAALKGDWSICGNVIRGSKRN